MLTKSKLNNIESLVSNTLIDMDICHKEFITILKEKDKYEKMKENVRNLSEKLEEKQENIRLNSVNSREISQFQILRSIYKTAVKVLRRM